MVQPTWECHRFRIGLRLACLGAGLFLAIALGQVSFGGPSPAKGPKVLDPADQHPGFNLIPWPQAVRPAQGRMRLTANSRIVTGQEELVPLAKVLAEEIALLTGLKLKVVGLPAQPGDIVLNMDPTIQAGESILMVRDRQLKRTREGAHRLAIDDQALVEGFDYRAVAEGTATLLQALGQSKGQVTLPKLAIHDWPHADYCAMMVDVGRQNHPVDWLKKMVQTCRFYKVRYLQLHLTDDQGWTFPSTRYPRLGSKNYGAHGGVSPKVYSLRELHDLVAYADARGVTIVPELEMPGHSGAALRSLPEIFDAINPKTNEPVGMGCMNMASEALYPALDTIIGEMCAVFKSSPYFHIGGDEVSMGRVALHSGYQAFMKKHRLKNDEELGKHFILQVNEMVKKHGKKTLKWEGLANEASKDVVVLCWDKNNNTASHLIAKGFTTITCPWDLGVPWEDWNMYICNGSHLKKGDSVLGATLVAWEQSPQFHLSGVRNVASRQERTWRPENRVTVPGFAARFQPLDAAVGKLVGIPVVPRLEATFTASAGTRDLLEPAFAFDGNEATFHQSDKPLTAGDHFTVALKKPRLVHALEVLTGLNQKGLLEGGEIQTSEDGVRFKTVATLTQGAAKAVLTNNRVGAVRLLAQANQTDLLVVREITLRLLVETAGLINDPLATIGQGNLALLKADTTFTGPMIDCPIPVINPGFTWSLKIPPGNSSSYSGPIRGTGKVEVRHGLNASLALNGKEPNTFQGEWSIRGGRLVLAKEAGVAALGGVIRVGGENDNDGLVWNNHHQIEKSSRLRLLNSSRGGATLDLNGFTEAIASLTMEDRTKIMTNGPAGMGVLNVGKLTFAGKELPQGIYTAASPWIQGGGYVVVGDVKIVEIAGVVDDPIKTIGPGNIALLKAPATIKLKGDDHGIPINLGVSPLTLASEGGPVRHSGFITGVGPVRILAPHPLEITGAAPNSYQGPTVLARGVLKLNKSAGVWAIPGNLELGGPAPENQDNGVIWGADGQLPPTATVTLLGPRPAFLDLASHRVHLARLILAKTGVIRAGPGGALSVKQLYHDGKRWPDGLYKAPQPWLEGNGTVTIDARVDVQGIYGEYLTRIGSGNIANMKGNTTFAYPVADCDLDIINHGHSLTFDSGNGNPFCQRGVISGNGEVIFLMGPTSTDHKDAPLRLAGPAPNTMTGKFLVRKGRVQLEKPAGVDALSADVIVGGQGFNDCLFWKNSNQIKDTATITLIQAGNHGAAYLHLNGCQETVAALTMTSANTVKTDSPEGLRGVLTVKALTIDGVNRPAGTYTSATEKWIEGKGQVIVAP